MQRSFPLLLVFLLAVLPSDWAPAPRAESRSVEAEPQATVSGIVYDSLQGTPLVGALVQLVSGDSTERTPRSTVTNIDGRFSFNAVPDGSYLLGFFHALLDSLGVEAELERVNIAQQQAVSVSLVTPDPLSMRGALCPNAPNGERRTILAGLVRNAATRQPPARSIVDVSWLEVEFSSSRGVRQHTITRRDTTTSGGWYIFCGVPTPGTVTLTASSGADSTDRIALELPARGATRRDLYVGASRRVAAQPTADASVRPATVRTGPGRLSGVVLRKDSGLPLADAQINMFAGPIARTNAQGEWSISNAPSGSRTLEVRAVGHYPEQRVVDVVDGSSPLRVSLSTLQSVLDTVRVSASTLGTSSLLGFEQRRRAGFGRFLSSADIGKRAPVYTSDLFRSIPGLVLEPTESGDFNIRMRGVFSDRCAPNFVVDGIPLARLTAADLDSFVRPAMIIGMEVYTPGNVPVEFQDFTSALMTDTTTAGAQGGCGAIVIWTR